MWPGVLRDGSPDGVVGTYGQSSKSIYPRMQSNYLSNHCMLITITASAYEIYGDT